MMAVIVTFMQIRILLPTLRKLKPKAKQKLNQRKKKLLDDMDLVKALENYYQIFLLDVTGEQCRSCLFLQKAVQFFNSAGFNVFYALMDVLHHFWIA